MNRLPVDPEEMALRHDEDHIASLRMVSEGAPIFDSSAKGAKEHYFQGQQLPETYQ
ncbi:hypothetical protein [Sporosarcina jiandibaonis]|uniref:hypothetical protein n=1 Tax=Sporosarcina jiandibaonis TaxID=2715535 RepID=UPI00155223FB|nr:hypothetical protein [Sporosarcina jiandibaonis]